LEVGESPALSRRSDKEIHANCDLTGYKSAFRDFTPPVGIPDNTGQSVVVGPIVLPADTTLIGDVVIGIEMEHSRIGDLIVNVGYDPTGDGSLVTATIVARPGRTDCASPGASLGCGADMVCDNTYRFDDSAPQFFGETAPGACAATTPVPAGCYRPTGPCRSPLSVFEQYRKGGSWYLGVSDAATGDVGVICGWSVHIRNESIVGAAPASWSTFKKRYD
jgi:subtilisin-like proprotein convertase family protein